MPNSFRSFAALVLPLAAFATVGCQSPWQSGTPVAGDSGWFSWLTASERSSGDPLQRLAGGGVYSPGVAEADSGAERSRQQLYGGGASQLDLSAGTATNPQGLATQSPAPQTLDQSLPQPDDAASRVAQSLRSRYEGTASPAVAQQPAERTAYDGAVAPAGYQAADTIQPPAGSAAVSPLISSAPRAYVDTAPADAERNPFYDPFGDGRRVSAPPAAHSTSTATSTTKPSTTGSSALRMLTTPSAPAEASGPTLSVPNGSSSASGSLLKLLGDNPLREGAPAPSGN
jgi:hypothetical protein